jgi:hypothetical protein
MRDAVRLACAASDADPCGLGAPAVDATVTTECGSFSGTLTGESCSWQELI